MDHIGFKVENLEVLIQDLEILIKAIEQQMVCMVVMNRNSIRIEAELVETNLESVSGMGLYSAMVPFPW
jgi:hypothetical protein